MSTSSFFERVHRRIDSRNRGGVLALVLKLAVLLFLLLNAVAVLSGLMLWRSLSGAHDAPIAAHAAVDAGGGGISLSLLASLQVDVLTRELVSVALSHPRDGPARVLGNGTLVCTLALLHAWPDDLFLDHAACTPAQVVAELDAALAGGRNVAQLLPSRCLGSSEWKQIQQRPPRCPSLARTLGSVAGRENVRREFTRALMRMKSMPGTLSERSTPPSAEASPGDSARRDDFGANLFFSTASHRSADSESRPLVFTHLGYAIPEVDIVARQDQDRRRKLWDFFPLLPGAHPHHHGPYVFSQPGDECLYDALLSRSLFAFTHVRGGADSLRTYSAIAAGSVPYFADLPAVPPFAVPHLPRALLLDAVTSLGGLERVGHVAASDGAVAREQFCCGYREGEGHINFDRVPRIDWASFRPAAYRRLRAQLLDFARRSLTCRAAAARFLAVLGSDARGKPPRRLLLISDGAYDYTTLMLLTGLAESELVDSVAFVDLHRNRLRSALLFNVSGAAPLETVVEHEKALRASSSGGQYGNGFGFARRFTPGELRKVEFLALFEDVMQSAGRAKLRARILRREFDAVVYTSVSNAIQLFEKQEAGAPPVRLVSTLPLLPDLVEFEAGLRPLLAIVDGSDTGTVPAALLRQMDSELRATAYTATFFVRELTKAHF